MIIKITPAQKDFLINNVLQNRKELISQILTGSFVHSKWHINISDDIADEIRNECLEMLPLVGFDENYSLNKQGVILDDLIDTFYVSETPSM